MKIQIVTSWDRPETNRDFINYLKQQKDAELRFNFSDLSEHADHLPRAEGIFYLNNADATSLYFVISSYFNYSSSDEAALTISEIRPGVQGSIFITRDEFRDVANETPNMYTFSEILASKQVFEAVWPDILLREQEVYDDEEEETEGENEFVVLDQDRNNLFYDLFGDPDTIRDEVSFLVYGASIFDVMDKIALVPSYENEIDERLISEIPAIDSDIVAVIYETSLGDVVELRVPLPQGSRAEAFKRVASKSKDLKATVYVVIGESEYGDEFTVQKLLDGGLLFPPETISMGYLD